MDSFAACVRAMYSDSVEERATVGCFLAAHEIAPPHKVKIYPPIDFLSSPPPQFASLYPSKTSPLLPSKVMPKLLVPQRYLNTRFVAESCVSDGQLENCE